MRVSVCVKMPRGIRRPPPKCKCGKIEVRKAKGNPRKPKYIRGPQVRGKLNLGKVKGQKPHKLFGLKAMSIQGKA